MAVLPRRRGGVQVVALGNARGVSVSDGRMSDVTGSEPKANLYRYLQAAREAPLWKLDGLSEYDICPLTPTGTNLLGLINHVASVELGSFGDTSGGRSMSRCLVLMTPNPPRTCGQPPTNHADLVRDVPRLTLSSHGQTDRVMNG